MHHFRVVSDTISPSIWIKDIAVDSEDTIKVGDWWVVVFDINIYSGTVSEMGSENDYSQVRVTEPAGIKWKCPTNCMH